MSAPKITAEDIENKIRDVSYMLAPDGRTTICVITMKNGFTVIGTSACISAENFDETIGKHIARENAVSKCWELEGYLLTEQLYQSSLV